jgi:hypothetical protein
MKCDIIMSYIFHSHYALKALESLGSERRIHLVDNSYWGELAIHARRNPHIDYIRPQINRQRGPPFSWHPLTCAESWNLAMSRAETPYVINVNPDMIVIPQTLPMIELVLGDHGIDDIAVWQTPYYWNIWLGKVEALLQDLGGFDARFRPCAGEDEDMLVRISTSGKWKWSVMNVPAHHQDGGHKDRVDEYCNVSTFVEKHGWRPHSPEYNKVLQQGRAR